MNADVLPTATRRRVTKCTAWLCAAVAAVSFLGYLPKFAPFVCLSLRNCFFPPFPKPWTLITGLFYADSVLSVGAACAELLLAAQILEPILGSREFVRVFTMCGVYAGLLIAALLAALYAATRNAALLSRAFAYTDAGIGGLLIIAAHRFFRMRVPTLCGALRIRELPFWALLIEALFCAFGRADGLISALFGMALSFCYVRWIALRDGRRGDSSFRLSALLPGGAGDDDANGAPAPAANPFRGAAHTVG